MSAETSSDYGEWRKKIKQATECAQDTVVVNTDKALSLGPFLFFLQYKGFFFSLTLGLAPTSRPPPPVEVGQIVLAQLISSVTAEGYSIQVGHEHSYVHDSSYDTPDWTAPPRPAVVLSILWDDRVGTYRFWVVAIARFDQSSNPTVSISRPDPFPSNAAGDSVSFEPDWPLPNSYCYVVKCEIDIAFIVARANDLENR